MPYADLRYRTIPVACTEGELALLVLVEGFARHALIGLQLSWPSLLIDLLP